MDVTEYGQRTDVYIFYKDPTNRAAVLSVSAEAAIRSIVEPSIIDFGQVADSTLPVSKEVSILMNDDVFSANDAGIALSTSHAHLKIDSSRPAVGRSNLTPKKRPVYTVLRYNCETCIQADRYATVKSFPRGAVNVERALRKRNTTQLVVHRTVAPHGNR